MIHGSLVRGCFAAEASTPTARMNEATSLSICLRCSVLGVQMALCWTALRVFGAAWARWSMLGASSECRLVGWCGCSR